MYALNFIFGIFPLYLPEDISTIKLIHLIDIQNANTESWLIKFPFSPASRKFLGIHALRITLSKDKAVLDSSRIESHTFCCWHYLGRKN